ncbi:MAG TPA: MinD/ParA family protein [Syntrophobacteraceae bacterium]|nr:MinD/ParA family protein [Syntrophobacteraceae bacterium]
MDQAVSLRERKAGPIAWSKKSLRIADPQGPLVRVLSVSSGKGGVGKSSIVVNLAVAFAQLGKKVLIMDADLGLANIDVLLGLTPKENIAHVLEGKRQLREVIINGPGGVRIMPASSGVQQLTRLTDEQKLLMLEMLDELESEIDIFLVDTGAGISDTVLYFNLAAQEKIVVITPEPTSLTDAYALIKVLYTRYGERHFRVLANFVEDEKAGKGIFAKISTVADHFLDGISLDYIGSIPRDPNVPRAILQQRPLLHAFPRSAAARAFLSLAERIRKSPPHQNNGNVQFFWKRLLQV